MQTFSAFELLGFDFGKCKPKESQEHNRLNLAMVPLIFPFTDLPEANFLPLYISKKVTIILEILQNLV